MTKVSTRENLVEWKHYSILTSEGVGSIPMTVNFFSPAAQNYD